MAYFYIDDHSPESNEYVTNYKYFDENESGALAKMMRLCLEMQKHENASRHKRTVVECDCLSIDCKNIR